MHHNAINHSLNLILIPSYFVYKFSKYFLSNTVFFLLKVTKQAASWIGSLMPLAALAGGILGGPMLEASGRKKTILFTAFPFILASLMVTHAKDVTMIYAGRAITGQVEIKAIQYFRSYNSS